MYVISYVMIVMCFRVIVGILDVFYFDLRNFQYVVVNLLDVIVKKKVKGEIIGMGFIYYYNIELKIIFFKFLYWIKVFE